MTNFLKPSKYKAICFGKIPEEMAEIENQIAHAMLQQFPSIRVVCHDDGVEGLGFETYASLKLEAMTVQQTRYREHGHEFLINPAVAYFSVRLGTQRMQTLESVSSFRREGRPLVIADHTLVLAPLALLYSEADIVSKAYVNDMNPEATPLLKTNMEQFHTKERATGRTLSKDAETVEDNPEMIGCRYALGELAA